MVAEMVLFLITETTLTSFNEPANRWLRKCPASLCGCDQKSSRFNEAATRWSRKYTREKAMAEETYCFNEAATRWSRKSLGLSACFRIPSGFNEAATRWSRKYSSCVSGRASGSASMRPRPDGRGNNGQPGRIGKLEDASMRPRPDGRGNCRKRPL